MAQLGQTRTIHAEFTAAGVDTDPTTIALTITDPDGTVTTPVPVHDGSGKYHYDLLLSKAGTWTAKWTGTGAVPTTATQTITVAGRSTEGPCGPWITWPEISEYVTPPTLTPALQDAVLMAATRTLWERSCKQFGLCSIIRARVTPLCRHSYTWRAGHGYSTAGDYGYGALGFGGSRCDCGAYEYVDLGVAPVFTVDEVWIDGVVLTPSAYRVDDWRWLVRTDGNPWPPTSIQPNPGQPNTLEVSRTIGLPIPDDGRMAAALLATKLGKEALEDCEPSANATNIAREGVTITINPPKGDTGIVLVEQWLGNFRCGDSGLFDPGAHRRTIRTNT